MRYAYFRLLSLALAAQLTLGCNETLTGALPPEELVACDPLELVEQPIELGTIVAVGSDVAGTFYAVDQVGNDYRVFQSSGAELHRVRVDGSGSVPGDDGSLFLTFGYESPMTGSAETLAVSVEGASTRMAHAIGALGKSDFAQVVAAGEELSPVDPTALATLALRNLPGEVVVEYNANTADGKRLLVTRPRDDWSYEDFRVFFGKPGSITERVVIAVTRSRDGGTTQIRFESAGIEYVALFPASLSGTPDPATLTTDSETLELTSLTAAEGLESLNFRCIAVD